jgi:L-alanine-DL-glutamate epimerase-like enolase superfamily enzyme
VSVIRGIEVRHLDLPLIKPYALSYRTFESFEPYLVRMITDDDQVTLGEQHISPGSSSETREGGWSFLTSSAAEMIGSDINAAFDQLNNKRSQSPVAATALLNALDQLKEPGQWTPEDHLRIPVLTAFSATTPDQIKTELDEKIELGFRTFKIKVGKDLSTDRERVRVIQDTLGDRGTIRVDANRAYSARDAIEFSQVLDPDVCELFEQPCDTQDWDGNGQVAKASPVPLMLDEPICNVADIERASTMPGVGFCKVKLKRFGSLTNLCNAIETAHGLGLKIVLGDGLGSDINCYLEALVSERYLDRAGEFNGCFKIRDDSRILTPHLRFEDGHMILEKSVSLNLNEHVIDTRTIRVAVYGETEN